MNPLDWALATLLVYSTVKALLQGFFREAFALGGLVAGLLFASWFYAAAAVHLAGLITSPPIAQCVAFLAVLAITMAAFSLAGKLLHKTASAVGLGMLDRLAGAAFGFLRGCLLGIALLMAFTAFLPTAPWIRTSRLAPYFLRGAHAVSFLVPHDLGQKLRDGTSRIKHTAPDWIKPGP